MGGVGDVWRNLALHEVLTAFHVKSNTANGCVIRPPTTSAYPHRINVTRMAMLLMAETHALPPFFLQVLPRIAQDLDWKISRYCGWLTIIESRSSTYTMSTKNGWKALIEGVYSENVVPVAIAADSVHHFNSRGALRRSSDNMFTVSSDRLITHPDDAACRPILDGLLACQFKVNNGIVSTDFGLLTCDYAGGHYLDRKIRLMSGSAAERLTEMRLKSEEGSELTPDVLIFAYG
ncbi:hypothetical protein Hypma_001167 [Hypsizygus marmoreus]|uniref:Uncharacterized protein n=1 Tax=Hypsizygus marmoreus TaxID=39966 RepID=A0A369J657_HYPMA|nr:hypothetical protein Hypma_001167 [Hypsizygus marmoreus]